MQEPIAQLNLYLFHMCLQAYCCDCFQLWSVSSETGSEEHGALMKTCTKSIKVQELVLETFLSSMEYQIYCQLF